MLTRKIIPLAIVAVVVSASAANASFSISIGASFNSHLHSRGVWIGAAHSAHVPPGHLRQDHWRAAPGHRGLFDIVRPRPRVIVVGPPVRREVVITRPAPVVIQQPAPVVVQPPVAQGEPLNVTVWVTNTNGSKTPVTLTHQGPGYVGPRGEYYPEMPNNEQLRMVYGF